MPSFVDTTVLISAAERDIAWKSAHAPYLKAHPPATTPSYAFRELTASVLQVAASAHNRVFQMQNPGDALTFVASLPDIRGRSKSGEIKALAQALAAALKQPSSGSGPMFIEARRHMCQTLMIKAQQMWSRARSSKEYQEVQALGCFTTADLELDSAGLLTGPGGRWGCDPNSRCAAAEHMHDKREDVDKLIRSIPPQAGEKRETTRRRQALKDLLDNGPTRFSKTNCRALGDAYFAVMSPPGNCVVTTNLVDHVPLCSALGKIAVDPSRTS